MAFRIALVSREFPPDHGGGIGSYAARIVPALVRAGAQVHVITRRLGEGEAEIELPEGATLHRVEMGDRSGESCLRASIVVARRLLELVRGTGLDAIEFAEYEGMGSAWLALRSLNERAASVPVAVHLHSPTELNAELNGHSRESLPRGMRELIDAERRCLALADGVCAPGSFMADWARDRFAMSRRPEVIPYSAEIEQALRVHAEGPPTLLYVGRLEQRKGVDTLIRAWNRIGASERSWLLHLVGADTNTAPGGGSCRAWLESLLDPPLRERTNFLGVMGVQALAAHRASAAVAVIPSRWENFPNTCIEAMGSGLPVVASDHGGMAEMLGLPARGAVADGPCGSVFPVGDDEALARTLKRWMRMEQAERMAAGDAARERIQQWCDPERVATRRVEWLESLRARPGKTDESLESLLRVGPIERAGALDEILQRTLERFDSATGADGRVGDPALWVKRMRGALGDCAKKGLSPVALYGAGHFTRSIGAALESPPVEVVCIVDDNPAAQGQWLHGLPVVSQEDALGLGVRAAILSANQWEDRLWESSRPLRDAGVEVVRLFGGGRVPRVMVVESGIGTRHFAGVTDQLKTMGFEVIGDTAHAVYPVPEDDLDLVCVADVLAPRNIAVLRAARAKGIRTLLMMDGVVEWRNTFINPLAGPNFLRPAPVDFVCCATVDDEKHLRELGNTAHATGLPRLDDLPVAAPNEIGPLLVATANTPSFNDAERQRLIEALRELKRTAEEMGIPVRWRLTGGLQRVLGVENHPGPLMDAMAGCRAVISTPSTLLLEAALAGLPIAVLDPFEQPAFDGMPGVTRSADARDLIQAIGLPDGWVRGAYPPKATGRSASELVAERIAAIAHTPGRTTASAALLETVRLPEALPKGDRPRAVSVIVCDGSPVSGVTTFSLRMSEASAARADGWEWHTLLVQTQPRNAANDGLRELSPEKFGHVHVCALDPTADHHETLKACRAAIERLSPDVLAPNFSDMTWAVAAQLRYLGVRTLGIMHSDDEAYRTLLRERPIWDAGVAVSAECAQQMKRIATEAFADPPPVEQITYGVPVSSRPPASESGGPLRLVYVGRLVEHQKRVSRLIELAACLRDLGCRFTLDLIGDGPSESALRAAIGKHELDGTVRLTGRLAAAEVQALLRDADCSVLVSDFEGTSISMLEAMGAGVVPCVSRVASGVDEWIEDGRNGVTAAVGDVDALAREIARLDGDRMLMERMKQSAWETASGRASIGAMYERYALILDEVMQRPLSPEPSDLGLHLTEGGRWFKPWCDDPQGASDYARLILQEAGYQSIACDKPMSGCDAVLVDTSESLELTHSADGWRARGLGVAFVPLIIMRPGWVRLDEAICSAVRSGSERIALYGAGQHTQRALPLLLRHRPIVGVIDDGAAGGMLAGIPVVGPDEAIGRLNCDAVVLSSDTVEEKLWRASESLRRQGIPVYSVYGAYAEEPIASATV